MISATLIVVFLLALILLIWKLVWRGSADAVHWDATAEENKIDLEVLELLLSREEDQYLRKVLTAEAFRSAKRERVTLARKYLRAINKNTGQLIKAAELVRSSSQNQQLVHAADELLIIAFRVRLNLPLVHLYLFTEWLFPTLKVPAPMRIKRYREMMKKTISILESGQLERTTKSMLS